MLLINLSTFSFILLPISRSVGLCDTPNRAENKQTARNSPKPFVGRDEERQLLCYLHIHCFITVSTMDIGNLDTHGKDISELMGHGWAFNPMGV